MEDILVVRGLGGFSAWLLCTQGVYYACLCTVLHRILLAALYLQVSPDWGISPMQWHPLTTAAYFQSALGIIGIRLRAQQGISDPRNVLGRRCQAVYPARQPTWGLTRQSSGIPNLALQLFSISTDAFSSAFSQWLPSLMHPSWCIKLVN